MIRQVLIPPPAGPVAQLLLDGPASPRLLAHPPGAPVRAGPGGIAIGPGASLRAILPPETRPETRPGNGAVAVAMRLSLPAADISDDGTILSMTVAEGAQLRLRRIGGRLVLQAGQAQRVLAPPEAGPGWLAFGVTALGDMLRLDADGLDEAVPAFDPQPALRLRQLHLGHRVPMVLHDLRLAAWPHEDSARLLDDLHALADTPRPAPGRPLVIHFNGQSLASGPRVAARDRAALGCPGRRDIRMLAGVRAGTEGRAVDLSGLALREGPVEIGAARLAPVEIASVMPPALAMAQALAHGTDPADGMRFAPLVLSGNPVAGCALARLDDPGDCARPNMEALLQATARALARDGLRAAHLAYLWIQGEADRTAARGDHLSALTAHWARICATLETLHPGVPRTMLLMQTAGTNQTHHPRDAYHPAADQLDFVAANPDAVLVGPLYPARLSDDIHPDLTHSRRIGELAAWALSEVLAGRPWTIARPSACRRGDRITLTLALRPDERLVAHPDDRYGGRGIDRFLGLEADGGRLVDMALDGHRIHLTVAGPVTRLRYAMQRQNLRGVAGDDRPARRGLIRSSLCRPARQMPGETLHRWLPSFEVVPREV